MMGATGHRGVVPIADGKLTKARRFQHKAALFAMTLVLAIAVAMIWLIVATDGPAYIAPRSRRIPIPAIYAKAVFLMILLPIAGAIAWGIGGQLQILWTTREPGVRVTGLALGEPVRWSGRPGLHSLTWQRRLLFTGIFPFVLIYLYWLWSIWSGSSEWMVKLQFTAFATVPFSGLVLYVITYGIEAMREWARDATGLLVVTDRRIAWLHPWRSEVYRSIDATEIVDVVVVEQARRRGWIAVTVTTDGGVAPVDLFGVPRPADAAAAVRRLVRSGS